MGSCKYGSECAYVAACACDCCLEIHECECDEALDEGGDDPEAA